MDGMHTYQLFADPSWSYPTPPSSFAAPGQAGQLPMNGWHPETANGNGMGFHASSTSPDSQGAFYDPGNTNIGGSYPIAIGAANLYATPVSNASANGGAGANGGGASGGSAAGAGAGGGSAPASEKASTGKWRPDREAPVKNACLTCRGKKARCDGVRPICGQCSKKSLECVYVKSRRGGARKKREAPPPSALQEFLKKLDGLVSVQDPSLSPGDSELGDDTTNVVRTFASREEL